MALLSSAKTYELSLTRNYVSKWGMVQAVRELIQNALDSSSPFVYKFARQEDGTWNLTLSSEFSTLLPSTLLLGSTSKADDKDSIGSFGEGYKIAMLVLTRLGHDVVIHNGNVDWVPRFRFNKRFNEELLVIEEVDAPAKNKGLTFEVQMLDDGEVDEIRDSCLQMQDSVGEIKSTRYGDILMERPGMLYVGGLFITKTEMKFGYNIKPEFIQLERDRSTVSSWDLGTMTRDMWFDTGELDRVAQMMADGYPDLEYAEYGCTDLVKDACFRHFQKEHPGKVIAKDDAELRAKVRQGMVVYVGSSGSYHSAVSRSSGYLSMPINRVVPPYEILNAWFEESKFHMHEKTRGPFREILKQAQNWKA